MDDLDDDLPERVRLSRRAPGEVKTLATYRDAIEFARAMRDEAIAAERAKWVAIHDKLLAAAKNPDKAQGDADAVVIVKQLRSLLSEKGWLA